MFVGPVKSKIHLSWYESTLIALLCPFSCEKAAADLPSSINPVRIEDRAQGGVRLSQHLDICIGQQHNPQKL